MSPHQPYRKRRNPDVRVADPFAVEMRRVQRLSHHGTAEEAKIALDKLEAESFGDVLKLAKILSARAHLLEREEQYENAAAIYREAWLAAREGGDERYWVGPAINELTNWLRIGRKERGLNCAEILLGNAAADELSARRAAEEIAALPVGSSQEVPPRPYPLGIVETRVADAFYEMRYLDEASQIYAHAISTSSGRASRARQKLASIFLSLEDYPQAEQLAKDSILAGRFQSKTIASWATYVTARDFQGKTLIEAELREGLLNHPVASVRARGVLELVKLLRLRGDESWDLLAEEWMAGFAEDDKVVAAEIRKLRMAEEKAVGHDDVRIAELAFHLLSDETSSKAEVLAAAKDLLGAKLRLGRDPQAEAILGRVGAVFGADFEDETRYSLARTAFRNRADSLAGELLRELGHLSASDEIGRRREFLHADLNVRSGRHEEAFQRLLRLLPESRADLLLSCFVLQRCGRWLKSVSEEHSADLLGRLTEFLQILEEGDLDHVSVFSAVRTLRIVRFPETISEWIYAIEGKAIRKAVATIRSNQGIKPVLDSIRCLNSVTGSRQSLVDQEFGYLPMALPRTFLACSEFWKFMGFRFRNGDADVGRHVMGGGGATISSVGLAGDYRFLRRQGFVYHLFKKDKQGFVSTARWLATSYPSSDFASEATYWLVVAMSQEKPRREAETKSMALAVFRAIGTNRRSTRKLQILARIAVVLHEMGEPTPANRFHLDSDFVESQRKLLKFDGERAAAIS